jgi:glycosyltransferase involved in cell wall biosynthesis
MPIPSVSIVIPTFNRVENLKRALASVLAQTITEIEVIVVDDGSTDQTLEMLSKNQDPRLLVEHLHKNSGGPSIPRNVGVRKARGEWLAFLDSDDWWEPQHLESKLAAIARSGTRAACGNAYISSAGISEASQPQNSTKGLETLHGFMPTQLGIENLLSNNLIITSSVVMRREDVIRVHGFPSTANGPVHEDYAVWLRASTFTNFTVSNEVTVHYQTNSPDSYGAMNSEESARENTFLELQRWLSSQESTNN